MFDPKAFLDSAVSKLNNTNKIEIVRDMLEQVARFVDQHDIIVPDLHVKVGIVDISLTAKKLEDADASKRIEEEREAKTDPEVKPDFAEHKRKADGAGAFSKKQE